MTWRNIPQHWYQRIQVALLATTFIVGWGIALTPVERNVSTLTVIEQAMSADYWALGLVGFSAVALLCELVMWRRGNDQLVVVVSVCHIMLCSLLVGYAAAALWGVLFRIWWNFGAPVMGAYLAYMHYVFTKRRRSMSGRWW